MGENLARNFHEAGALAAVYDQNKELCDLTAAKYDVAVLSFDEMLSDDQITQIAIATPVQEHFQMVKDALIARKDVWVEKPLCMSALESKELLDLSQAVARYVFVDYLPVYHPAISCLKERLQYFTMDQVISVETSRQAWGVHRPEGVIWDLLCHDFALMQYLFPELIMGDYTTDTRHTLTPPVVDTATVTYADGKTKVSNKVSCAHPVKEQKMVITTRDAAWSFDALAEPGNQLIEHKMCINPMTVENTALSYTDGEPLRRAVDHFLACCQDRISPITSVEFDACRGLD